MAFKAGDKRGFKHTVKAPIVALDALKALAEDVEGGNLVHAMAAKALLGYSPSDFTEAQLAEDLVADRAETVQVLYAFGRMELVQYLGSDTWMVKT